MEAQAGAKIVFWSELNGAVLKQDEDMLLQRASDMAKQEEIHLIVSLLVKTPYVDLKENKTVAFNPQGELISEYFKHRRSIGKLCQKGDGMLKSFDTEYGRIAPLCRHRLIIFSLIQRHYPHRLSRKGDLLFIRILEIYLYICVISICQGVSCFLKLNDSLRGS